ncbi:MAG: EamA family transporter [Atopobiaceae bacterium]|nr:EamA family transporter [Atopobiaceae bacterium]
MPMKPHRPNMQTARLNGRMAVGILSTLLGAVAWGFSGTCVQFLFASSSLSSLTVTTIRELGAGLVFLIVLLVRNKDQLKDMLSDKGTLRRLLIFGSCGLFLNSALYATTILYTNAGTATVLQSLNIVMVLGVTCIVMRRRPRGLEMCALLCALAATFLIATHANPQELKLPPLGLAFGLATAAAATFYTMYPKPLFERWGSFAVTGMGMLFGGLTGAVVCLITGTGARDLPQLLSLDATGYVVLAVAVLVGTFGAYGLFLHGISIVGPVAGNMLGAAEPVSATVISALWLGTSFVWADWAGLALMVLTIFLIALPSSSGDGTNNTGKAALD